MKTVKTSLTGEKEIGIPYRFVCNYCGKQNHKVLRKKVFSSFTKSGNWEGNRDADRVFQSGLVNNLARSEENEISRRKKDLEDLKNRVRRNSLFQPVENEVTHTYYIPTTEFDGVCEHCGRRQAWDFRQLLRETEMPEEPVKEAPKWKSILRVIALIVTFIGPLVLGILSYIFKSLVLFIFVFICFFVGFVTAGMLTGNTPPEVKSKKRKRIQIRILDSNSRFGTECPRKSSCHYA